MNNDNHADPMASRKHDLDEEQAALSAQKAEVIARLADLNVARCEVEYDGYGDTGAIDTPHCYDAEGQRVDLPKEVGYLLEEFVLGCLEDHHEGWEIDDGSFGTATISVGEERVEFSHQFRETIYLDDDFEV